MRGFICVPREVWEWPNWDRRTAYIDLQHRCSWGEQHIRTQGQTISVQRGEVLFSAREAALWWRCSEKAVRLTMEWLESEGLITYPEGKQHRRMFRVAMVDYFGDVEQQGARKGATKGASNPLQDGDLHESGAQERAQRRAQHIEDQEIEDKQKPTVPSEQCAQDEADLFGGSSSQPPVAAEPESTTTIARRVVALFHELSKAGGGNGVSTKDWPAQLKMTTNALGKGDMSEQAACEALRWGMRQEYQRRRLRADGLKVLRYVWSEWVEETGGETNGNGRRNGTGGATGNGGTAQTGAGAVPVVVNGRWERRGSG